MPAIVLATLNAKYPHCAFGLRYLLANMGELRDETALLEFTINQQTLEILDAILAQRPRIVGLGVYIWNVAETTRLVADLKRVAPEVIVVLGGPEVSYETDQQEIARLADYVITGEADLAFAALCRELLSPLAPAGTAASVVRGEGPGVRGSSSLVPSPPSSGERARVRGPSGDDAHNLESIVSPSSSSVSQLATFDSQPTKAPLTLTLSPEDGGEGTKPKIIHAPVPALTDLALPYDLYSDEDITQRVLYVEASRGCPFTCEFCLSALDIPVRQFPLEEFLAAMGRLLERGAKQFKFVDRTFNLNLRVSRAILDFFLQRYQPGMFLHFELIPDRLPDSLKELIVQFPPGALQFEVGIQTFNDDVSNLISRHQDNALVEQNLSWLSDHTSVHVHADLIVGLPGESLDSFAEGFNRLVKLAPHEIQVGILKRLRGTPIVRHDAEWQMVYSPHPPYEVLQTKLLDFSTIQELRRFAKLWDTIANSGNFVETVPMLWEADRSKHDQVSALVPSPPPDFGEANTAEERASSPLKKDRRVGPVALRRAGSPPNTVTADGGPALETSLSHPTDVFQQAVSPPNPRPEETPHPSPLPSKARGEGTGRRPTPSPFAEFRRLSSWLFACEGHSHGISLSRLVELLFVYLTTERDFTPEHVAAVMWRDYQRGGRSDKPACLKPFIDEVTRIEKSRPVEASRSPKRQTRHVAAIVLGDPTTQ